MYEETIEILKNADDLLPVEQFDKKILKRLEKENKIIVGKKGVLWIYNDSKKLDAAIKKGVRV